jgi:hypothetical protein
MLTGVGVVISDFYSYPAKSLFAYIALSTAGWAAAGFVTAFAAGGKPGLSIRLAAWVAACLASILLGLHWLFSWNNAYLGPVAAIGVAGSIGGLFSARHPVRHRLVAGVLTGLAFFLLSLISFYVSYFLIYMYSAIVKVLGETVTLLFSWGLPGVIFGLCAGFLARWILGIKPVKP